MRTSLFLIAAAALVIVGSPVSAQQPHRPPPPLTAQPMPGHRLNSVDRRFVRDALLDGYFEVDMGRLAERNGEASGVKRYGGWMVRYNRTADGLLTALAERKGTRPPQGLDPRHLATLNRFQQLRGQQFDRAYLTAMVQDHDNEIRAFHSEVTNGGDPDLRRLARNALVHLSRYDQLAHQMNDRSAAAAASAPRRR